MQAMTCPGLHLHITQDTGHRPAGPTLPHQPARKGDERSEAVQGSTVTRLKPACP